MPSTIILWKSKFKFLRSSLVIFFVSLSIFASLTCLLSFRFAATDIKMMRALSTKIVLEFVNAAITVATLIAFIPRKYQMANPNLESAQLWYGHFVLLFSNHLVKYEQNVLMVINLLRYSLYCKCMIQTVLKLRHKEERNVYANIINVSVNACAIKKKGIPRCDLSRAT